MRYFKELINHICAQVFQNGFIMFTIIIWTPILLTIIVLRFEQSILPPSEVSKNCWISGKQFDNEKISYSVAMDLDLPCFPYQNT